MAKRDIYDRYMGQVFGAFWAIFHPFFLMAIYVFIFSVVLKLKISDGREMPLDYTAYLLSGLIPWLCFADSIQKSSTIILNHSSLVKQIIFPIEILPIKGVIASLLSLLVGFIFLIIYIFLANGIIFWTFIVIPVLLFLQILGMIGLAFVISSAAVYFRDLKDFVQLFCLATLYALPVFYLPQWLPSFLKPLLYANPFSYMVWCYRDIFYYGKIHHPWAWVIFPSTCIATFIIGYAIFKKFKNSFGNFL
jgi:lipopolysaccharide transport system permease protein